MSRNFAVISMFILFTTHEKTRLKNKRVGVLRMAFRDRKVFGSFEKRGNYSHTVNAVKQLFSLTALKSKSNQRSVRFI